jgi:hypothetical protein
MENLLPKRVSFYLILIISIGLLVGCLGDQIKLPEDATPLDHQKAKYFVALRAYNDLVQDYITFYEFSTPEMKKKLAEKVKPIALAGYDALDAWKSSIGAEDIVAKREAYIRAKDRLIVLLFQFGIVEISE